MLKPASDRINYGDTLRPPDGYRLEHAIGTTYSLDLETLTAAAISLGLKEDTDSRLLQDKIGMLSGIQKISDRIVIFCEAGQIKVPEKKPPLFLTLEKMVVPVCVPMDPDTQKDPAFHAKTWALEYGNDDGHKQYRFIVLSRNMTFDHSWDVACCLNGDTAVEEGIDAEPLSDFLFYLRELLNPDLSGYAHQERDLTYMAEVVRQVRFRLPHPFHEGRIIPLGIGKQQHEEPVRLLLKQYYNELVVVSPFLTGSVIEGLNHPGRAPEDAIRTLITRRSELSKLAGGQASNFDVYVMKDHVIDGESALSEGEEDRTEQEEETEQTEPNEQAYGSQDIHAKIYLRRKGTRTDLFLGSMNATYAATNYNVEMMLLLRTTKGKLNGKKFLSDLMGDDPDGRKNPFEQVEPGNEEKADEKSLQDRVQELIKRVCRINMSAEITCRGETYDIHVHAALSEAPDGKVTVSPFRSGENRACELCEEMAFQGLKLLEVSEFYTVSATMEDCTLQRVIMIPTSGIPEERDAEIIRDIISNRGEFIDYVAFILGDDYVQAFLESGKAGGSSSTWNARSRLPAIYEKMLRISAIDPLKLMDIQAVTDAIEKEDIVPGEFREMYDVFLRTLGIKQV
ncbi:MAG: phospholipase D family protein [Clostridia bacterium]|nr:phospholipase D family protein [Clostridia bacterium]